MKQCPICDTPYPAEHTTCSNDGARLLEVYEWQPGTLISNRFRIIEKLGSGGMGSVYKAEHVTLRELRALKVMALHLSSDPQFIKRFQYEAQKAVRLAGVRNVAQVYDLQQAEDGNWFIVMEYVGGGSLRSLLQQEGRLPVDRALRIAEGIAEGLAEAHAAGIIHRDIKPENIMLGADRSRQEVAKIVDFGIVASKEGSLTLKSTRLLTPQYAAPEQWRGMPAAELDGRADLYALGITLYEMLTGRLPYSAESTEGWMHAHIYTDPPPPSSLNPALAGVSGLDELVLGCLQRDRERRPRNAEHLVEQIDTLRRGGSSRTLPYKLQERLPPLVAGQQSGADHVMLGPARDNEQDRPIGFFHSKQQRHAALAGIGVAVLVTSLLIWTIRPNEETGNSGAIGESRSVTGSTDTVPHTHSGSEPANPTVQPHALPPAAATKPPTRTEVASTTPASQANLDTGMVKTSTTLTTEGTAEQWQLMTKESVDLLGQGKIQEAISVSRSALELAKVTYGEEGYWTGVSLNNLGFLYLQNQNLSQAEPLLVQAEGTLEKTSGAQDRERLRAMTNLATLYALQGRSLQAEKLIRQVVTTQESALGTVSPELVNPLVLLADICANQNKKEEARSLFTRALRIQEDSFGESRETGYLLAKFAYFSRAVDDTAEARKLYRRAVPILEKHYGANHAYTITARNALMQLGN